MSKADTIVVTADELRAVRATPAQRARFDAMTDADIDAQIAADPDVAPILDEAWFARARAQRQAAE